MAEGFQRKWPEPRFSDVQYLQDHHKPLERASLWTMSLRASTLVLLGEKAQSSDSGASACVRVCFRFSRIGPLMLWENANYICSSTLSIQSQGRHNGTRLMDFARSRVLVMINTGTIKVKSKSPSAYLKFHKHVIIIYTLLQW